MDYKSRANVYHSFSVMLEAGVSLKKAIATSAEGGSGRFRWAFAQLGAGIGRGLTLAQAMRENEEEFAPIDIMLAQTGDETGETAECFKQLGAWYTMQLRMKRIIRSGMIMPVLIFHAGIFFVSLVTFALSGFAVWPALIQYLTALALFWVPVLAIIAIRKFSSRDNKLKRTLDSMAIWFWGIRIPARLLAFAQYTRGFHTLYKAGVPITTCAQRAYELVGNSAAAKWFAGGIDTTRHGKELSEGFSPEVGSEFLNCWQVGEESGELDNVTERLAKQYEERAEFAFMQMASWLPRVVYCLVAVYLIYQIFKAWGKINGAFMGGI